MNELDSLRVQLESLNLRINGKHSALIVRESNASKPRKKYFLMQCLNTRHKTYDFVLYKR